MGFWSGLESCINGICREYEDAIQERCNASQIKQMKRLLKAMYKDKCFYEQMIEVFVDEEVIKKFPKFVSFNDRRDYLFDEVIKDSYKRDKTKDRKILDFCAALRNTMHNHGTHLKAEKEIMIGDKNFRLPKGEKMYNEQFKDIFIIARELFDIYLAIYDGLVDVGA